MSKRDDLIAVYTQDLKEKCGEKNPDVEFLTLPFFLFFYDFT